MSGGFVAGWYSGSIGTSGGYSGLTSRGYWDQVNSSGGLMNDQQKAEFASNFASTPGADELRGIAEYIWRLENDFSDRIMIDYSGVGLIHVAMNNGGAWFLPHTNISYWDYKKLGDRIAASENEVEQRKWRQGGISLVGDSPGPISQQDGMASHTMTIDGLIAKGRKPGGRGTKGINGFLTRVRALLGMHTNASPDIPDVIINQSPDINRTPTFFYGDSIEHSTYLDDDLRLMTKYNVYQYKVLDGDTTFSGTLQRSHSTKKSKNN